MRPAWTRLLNLLVPGAGLIVVRREWLGVAVALLFCVLAQIAVLGALLLPTVIPTGVAAGAGLTAGGVWVWSQWLLGRCLRSNGGGVLEREVALLCRRSDEARGAGDLAGAIDFIRAALTLNDEHPGLNRKWAELATLAGQNRDAVRAWRRVLQTDRDPDTRSTARRAIRALRDRPPSSP